MNKSSFLLGLFGLLLTSCQSIEPLSIDYLLPAEISFPKDLKRVAVVNNMPAYATSTAKDVVEPIHHAALRYQEQKSHGVASVSTEALAHQLAEGNYFEQVLICDSALRKQDDTPKATLLTQAEVQALTQGLGADFLIALEDVQLTTNRKVEFSPYYQAYIGTTDLKVQPTLRIYLPTRNGPIATLQPNDSIFWETLGSNLTQTQARLISQQELTEQASEFAGSIPVKQLLPHWKSSYRYLFSGGSAPMRDAAIYAREQNWPEAMALWEELYQHKQGKTKMQAAHNLAIGHEMMDHIVQALEWAQKAQKEAYIVDKVEQKKSRQGLEAEAVPNYALITFYVAELEKRKQDLLLLNIQMERFNE